MLIVGTLQQLNFALIRRYLKINIGSGKVNFIIPVEDHRDRLHRNADLLNPPLLFGSCRSC